MTKTTKKNGVSQEDLTKKLIWRLSKQPQLEDVTVMLEKGLIDKEEARQLLFHEEEIDTSPSSEKEKALKEQIKFLEGVVEKLTNRGVTVWPTIYYTPSYPVKYWYLGGALGSSGVYSVANNTVSLSTTSSSSNGTTTYTLSSGTGSGSSQINC